jgi:hypothetical protein
MVYVSLPYMHLVARDYEGLLGSHVIRTHELPLLGLDVESDQRPAILQLLVHLRSVGSLAGGRTHTHTHSCIHT